MASWRLRRFAGVRRGDGGGGDGGVVADEPSAVQRARITFNALDDPNARKRVRGVLAVMEADVAAGQEQLLIRVDDYPRASRSSLQELLRAALAE